MTAHYCVNSSKSSAISRFESSGQKIHRSKLKKIENLNFALDFCRREGVKLVGIGAEDIHDSNLKLILGLIWMLILRYQISLSFDSGNSEVLSPTSASNAKERLLNWVRSQISTEEYRISITNFDSCWQDGVALCALVHKFVPNAFDFHSLDRNNVIKNLEMAFDIAEKELGIPKVLDAQDVASSLPDEQSIMTYVSFFPIYYNNKKKREEEIRQHELQKLQVQAESQKNLQMALKEIEELKQEANKYQNEIATLKAELEQTKAMFEKMQREKDEEIAKLRAEMDNERSLRQKAETSHGSAQMESELRELQKKYETLLQTNAQLESVLHSQQVQQQQQQRGSRGGFVLGVARHRDLSASVADDTNISSLDSSNIESGSHPHVLRMGTHRPKSVALSKTDVLQAMKEFMDNIEVKDDNAIAATAKTLEQQIAKSRETVRDLQNAFDKATQQAALPENNANSELQERVKTLEVSLKAEKKQLEQLLAMEKNLKKEQRNRARFSRKLLEQEVAQLHRQLATLNPNRNASPQQETLSEGRDRRYSIDLTGLSNQINNEIRKRGNTRAKLTEEIQQLQRTLQFEANVRKDVVKSKNELKIQLAELEKQLEAEKEARIQLENLKKQLEDLLVSSKQGVTDAPEAFDLLKEFEALKETLDEEVNQRTKLEQEKLSLEEQLQKMQQLANDEITARTQLEQEYYQLKLQLQQLQQEQQAQREQERLREEERQREQERQREIQQKEEQERYRLQQQLNQKLQNERRVDTKTPRKEPEVTLPFENEPTVDELVEEFLNDVELNVEMKKVDEGIYQVGTKKLKLVVITGHLVVRVGGGFMQFKEWLNKYGKQHNVIVKPTANKGVAVSVRTGSKVTKSNKDNKK